MDNSCTSNTCEREETRLASEFDRLSEEWNHVKEKIANDARSPLITEWRRKRDKLKVEVDTAEAEWTSFKSQRMDRTPDLKRKRSFTIETLEELVEEIATTPDRNRRIRLGN